MPVVKKRQWRRTINRARFLVLLCYGHVMIAGSVEDKNSEAKNMSLELLYY